jgi:hypothetical protein
VILCTRVEDYESIDGLLAKKGSPDQAAMEIVDG